MTRRKTKRKTHASVGGPSTRVDGSRFFTRAKSLLLFNKDAPLQDGEVGFNYGRGCSMDQPNQTQVSPNLLHVLSS